MSARRLPHFESTRSTPRCKRRRGERVWQRQSRDSSIGVRGGQREGGDTEKTKIGRCRGMWFHRKRESGDVFLFFVLWPDGRATPGGGGSCATFSAQAGPLWPLARPGLLLWGYLCMCRTHRTSHRKIVYTADYSYFCTRLRAAFYDNAVDILPAGCSSRSLVLDEDVRSSHGDNVITGRREGTDRSRTANLEQQKYKRRTHHKGGVHNIVVCGAPGFDNLTPST